MEENLIPTPVQQPAPTRPESSKHYAMIAVVIFIVIVAVISVVAFKQASKQSKTTTPTAAVSTSKQVVSVSLGADSFTPQTVTVNAGTTVKWTVADSSSTHIIASDPYPSDNLLSSLKSKQLGNGASYSYNFAAKGTYTYHDDLHPTVTGTVIVK